MRQSSRARSDLAVNIAALLILTPVRLLVTPRYFHTINIFAARVCNLPVLLVRPRERPGLMTQLIGIFERSPLAQKAKRTQPGDSLPSRLGLAFEASAHADIDAVFEIVPETLPDTALGDDDDEQLTIRGQSIDTATHVGPQGAERASRMHPDVQRPPHASSRANSSRLLSAGKPVPPQSSTDEDEPRGRGRARPRGRPTSPRGRKEGLARIVTPMRREDDHVLRRLDVLESTLARIEESLRASLGGMDDDD